MVPKFPARIVRLLSHDTTVLRVCLDLGLVLMGMAMAWGIGAGAPGYSLLEQYLPLRSWGVIYVAAGCFGVYGCVNRLSYWARIILTLLVMYLWVITALAQFFDEPLPTRMLLIIPATAEVWILAKILAAGPRGVRDDSR